MENKEEQKKPNVKSAKTRGDPVVKLYDGQSEKDLKSRNK